MRSRRTATFTSLPSAWSLPRSGRSWNAPNKRSRRSPASDRPVIARPAWDLSAHTIELLAERGYLYDSSLMSDDFTVFRARAGDRIGGDGVVRWGAETNVLEFPVAWELDDFPHFAFVSRPMNVGLRNPDDVFAIWRGEFDYCHAEVPGGVFTLTMHPQVIGRGPRLRARRADHAHA